MKKLVIAALFSAVNTFAADISIKSLLNEMTNREALASFPQQEYKTLQFSSYDRSSKVNNPDDGAFYPKQGRDWGKGWFSNKDFSQFIRTETVDGRKEHVMLEQEGPGAIVRWWGIDYDKTAVIRIYLDNNKQPVIEKRANDLIGVPGIFSAPFTYKASDEKTRPNWRARNLYFPIPFQKHCKVTIEYKKGYIYYQINTRQYQPGTTVETFSLKHLADAQPEIAIAAERLTNNLVVKRNQVEELAPTVLKPNESASLQLSGTKAIQTLNTIIAADNMPQARRSTVIELKFDGKRTVWCPIGAFFGNGITGKAHRTLFNETDSAPANTKESGLLTSRWVMPFKKSAIITIHNDSQQAVTIQQLTTSTQPWNWNDRSMYFHGTWFGLSNVKGDLKKDINYVTVTGKGVYVGDHLSIYNTHPDWWGEGDEKIYVDGESFPSHFGTGTEDYYGYAWCRPQAFSHPFHSQPDGSGNKAVGFTSNNRYRTLDAIPFNSSISVNMELWHPFGHKGAHLDYAPATFWYALPGATSSVKPDIKQVQAKVRY